MPDTLLLAQADTGAPINTVPAPQAAPAALPPEVVPPPAPDGFLDQMLAFIYTLAHWAGQLIVLGLEQILPLQTPASLVDPIGYLALLTFFLIIAEIAKKITWIIVVIGWLLIFVRIALEVTGRSA